MKKNESGCVIIALYVDDINLTHTLKKMNFVEYWKKELGILHYMALMARAYTKNLVCFYMGKCHPLSTSIVIRPPDVKKDMFRQMNAMKKF